MIIVSRDGQKVTGQAKNGEEVGQEDGGPRSGRGMPSFQT